MLDVPKLKNNPALIDLLRKVEPISQQKKRTRFYMVQNRTQLYQVISVLSSSIG